MTSGKSFNGSAQLSFSFENDSESLVRRFEKGAGAAIMLVLTDNTTSMLSVKKKGALFYVRLHRIFLGADEDTLNEIAFFIKHGRGKMTRFRAFMKEMNDVIDRKPPGALQVRTLGKYHDLHSIFMRINQDYFEGKLSSVITWGNRSRRAVRKRTLGSYRRQTDTIRINPVLDRKTVPHYYIEFVVYHEMLHAAIGSEEKAKRCTPGRVHTRAFKERERLFKEYEKAIRWESNQ
jgi:hypothetical protein